MIRVLLVLAIAVAGAVAPQQPAPGRAREAGRLAAARPPHVLLIVGDDLGIGEVSAYGATDVRTPALDRLGAEGVRFTSFYANSPVCSPSRAALLSGRHPPLVGVPGVIRTDPQDSWGALRRDVTLLPEVLRRRGYRTALVGKWHLGLEDGDHPLDRGFETFAGFLGDMMDDYRSHRRHGRNYMREGRRLIDPAGHATDLFSQWAVDVIQRHDPQVPLFLYLAYNAPHVPIQPSDSALAAVRARQPELDARRAGLLAMVEQMDGGISRVLETLQRKQMLDTTLVIATSDNGGEVPAGATNNGLRGGKPVLYEGGIRIPAVWRWPARVPAGRSLSVPAQLMDIAPTIAEAAGASLGEVDGRSLWPLLGGKEAAPRDLFFSVREGARLGGGAVYALRRGPWVVLQMQPAEPWRLYNLDNDPSQRTDRAGDADVPLATMDAAARAFAARAESVPYRR